MIIYSLWEMLNFFFANVRVKRKQAVTLLCIILWLILGMRSIELGLYDTKNVYYTLFNHVLRQDFKEFATELSILNEPLMRIITWIIAHLTKNFQMYLLMTSAFPIFAIRQLLIEEDKDPVFGIAVFWGLYFFYGTFLVKQMMAMSMITFSYKYLKRRELAKFIICVCVGACIHKTSIFFIITYIACKYIKINKFFIISIFPLMSIGVFAQNFILNIIYKLPTFNFETYIYYGVYSKGQGMTFSSFFYLGMIIICYYLKEGHDTGEYTDLLIISYIGCVFNSWSTIIMEFYRLALYFNVFNCLLLPYALSKKTIKNQRVKRSILLVIMYIYAYVIAINTHSLPYMSLLD